MTALEVRPAAGIRTAAVSRARDLLASEWIKLRSVRSTYLTMLAAAIAAIGIGAIGGAANAARWSQLNSAERASFDPLTVSLFGMVLAQMAFGVLGVLVISSEHTTGMIRTTFAAVPSRRALLAAKTAVVGAVALVVGMVTSFASFLIGQALLSSTHAGASLATPGALRAVVFTGLYMMIITLIGVGLGAIIRHTAGAISALFGLILVLPQLVIVFPSPWNSRIQRLLPELHSLVTKQPVHGLFSPPVTLLVCAVYAVAALGAAAVLITRRDA
jgi:hypothetical protein